MVLGLSQIQAAAAAIPQTKDLDVAELGGVIRIRRLDAEQCVAMAPQLESDRVGAMYAAWWCCCIDADGGQVFGSVEQVKALGLPFGVVAQVFAEIAELSGLLANDEVRARAKNC
jgi:hypothetical protein